MSQSFTDQLATRAVMKMDTKRKRLAKVMETADQRLNGEAIAVLGKRRLDECFWISGKKMKRTTWILTSRNSLFILNYWKAPSYSSFICDAQSLLWFVSCSVSTSERVPKRLMLCNSPIYLKILLGIGHIYLFMILEPHSNCTYGSDLKTLNVIIEIS